MLISEIEIDYHENRPYKDEAEKRSLQFRELAKVINELVIEHNQRELQKT